MLSKRTRKRSQPRKPASKKRKPARRTSLFKSSSWYQAAARAIGISSATVAHS
jgi:DNA invertase Pin-like site-specific DNA recombinase